MCQHVAVAVDDESGAGGADALPAQKVRECGQLDICADDPRTLASASRIAAATVRPGRRSEDGDLSRSAFLATRHVEPGTQARVEGVVRIVAPRGFVEIVAATDQGHALLRREG